MEVHGYQIMVAIRSRSSIEKKPDRLHPQVDPVRQIENALVQLGSKGVEIPQPTSLKDYLIAHPDISEVVMYATEIAKQHFDGNAQLSLEVYSDPEIDDNYVTLYVRQNEYEDSLMKEIKEIRKAYESMLADKSGWFLVTTDFRTPV
jgi:hypothetical protein